MHKTKVLAASTGPNNPSSPLPIPAQSLPPQRTQTLVPLNLCLQHSSPCSQIPDPDRPHPSQHARVSTGRNHTHPPSPTTTPPHQRPDAPSRPSTSSPIRIGNHHRARTWPSPHVVARVSPVLDETRSSPETLTTHMQPAAPRSSPRIPAHAGSGAGTRAGHTNSQR